MRLEPCADCCSSVQSPILCKLGPPNCYPRGLGVCPLKGSLSVALLVVLWQPPPWTPLVLGCYHLLPCYSHLLALHLPLIQMALSWNVHSCGLRYCHLLCKQQSVYPFDPALTEVTFVRGCTLVCALFPNQYWVSLLNAWYLHMSLPIDILFHLRLFGKVLLV